MKRKRERIIVKARAKRLRKVAKQLQIRTEELPVVDISSQVKEVASVAAEKVGDIVKTATEAVKVVVTKKRFQ